MESKELGRGGGERSRGQRVKISQFSWKGVNTLGIGRGILSLWRVCCAYEPLGFRGVK